VNYSEILAAFVGSKKPLLIKGIVEQFVPKLSEFDRSAFFLDLRIYNHIIGYEKSRKLKLDIAKKLAYTGNINIGCKENKLLYRRATIQKGVEKEYYPNGFLKAFEKFNYTYKFYDGFYIQTTRKGNRNVLDLNKNYSTMWELFGIIYDKHSSFFTEKCDLINLGRIEITIITAYAEALKDLLREYFKTIEVEDNKVKICIQ